MINPSEPCLFLDWDTDFFGRRIARMQTSRLTPDVLASAMDWCRSNAIECLYFLADSDDPQTVWLAESANFHLVEVRYTLERSLKDWDPQNRPNDAAGIAIRDFQVEDMPSLQRIARTSYVDSRFYFDRHFSQEKWAEYYATWVKRSFDGGADLALVAEKDRIVVGYITGLVEKETNEGIYELTGVDPEVRRAGVGQELFRSGLDWYVEHHVAHIWVATQGRNVATQRMIQRHGFLSKSCQLYYHKWFEDEGRERTALS